MKRIKDIVRYGSCLSVALMLLGGCGEEANFDAIIIPPEDLAAMTVDGLNEQIENFYTNGPLLFKVQRSSEDPTPVPNIDIELFSAGLIGVTTILTDRFGNPLGTPLGSGSYFKTKTDDLGVVKVFLQWSVSDCGDATEDITTNANITAVISADQENWKAPITIACGTPVPLDITTTSLPDGTVGTPYSQTVTATGGTPPYTWSVTSGALPLGLSLNSATGIIGGTPTTAGTSSFTIRVTDSASATALQSLSIEVVP